MNTYSDLARVAASGDGRRDHSAGVPEYEQRKAGGEGPSNLARPAKNPPRPEDFMRNAARPQGMTLIARLSRIVAEGVFPRLEAVERQLAAMQPSASASANVAKAEGVDDSDDDQTELEALIADMERRQAEAEARFAALEAGRSERGDS